MYEYKEEERYILWLNLVLGPDIKKYNDIMEYYGSAKEAFYDCLKNSSGFSKMNGLKVAKEKLAPRANEKEIDTYLKQLEAANVKAVTLESKGYPELLKQIQDPPFVLYIKGTLRPDIKLPIAVIGSRACSDYGRRVTRMLTTELVQNGACIISGLATGIDSIAAEAALECSNSDYPTVAVLGSGIDVVYPASNKQLYNKIIERGAVISEYTIGTRAEKYYFPIRNRIISGMAKGVLVTEAREMSGTRITVNYALENGRDVFAVPGRITDIKSNGTNKMIKEGNAKFVTCVADILEEYQIYSGNSRVANIVDVSSLDENEKMVYNLLELGEKSFDEICEKTDFSPVKLGLILTSMEFANIVRKLPGNIYSL